MLEKVKNSKIAKKASKALAIASVGCLTSFPVFADTADTTTTTLNFEFQASEMFTWTNTMLSALMPCLYITLGISLAFIIINALKMAFR